jgi:hypothetical protein
MIGISLSPEQVRAAPPEVRRWLEHEIGMTFGLATPDHSAAEDLAARLVGCNPDEAAAMLELVQGMLPVVNVFFELGREAVSTAVHGLRAFQLADLARQAGLSTPQQVIECLDVLTAALRRVRGDGEALFYLLDDHGHCLVTEPTTGMRNVLHVWQAIVAQRALHMPPAVPQPTPVAAAPE